MTDHSEPRWRLLGRTDVAQAKKRAKELLAGYRRSQADVRGLFDDYHPDPPAADAARLADAQLVYARAHDFPSWPRFVKGAELFNAIMADNAGRVMSLLRKQPQLLNLPVNGSSSNWGPPLACAAQLGRQDVVDALLSLGGQDKQWALDRAVLKGRAEMARKLIAAGAEPEPGIVMGACETLNSDGLEFLAEIGAPLTDEHGDRLAPVAALLEGYYRDPAGKHACLAFFEKRGIEYPDTPLMAFHRGRLDLLRRHLRRDSALPARRFTYRDIYPLECGCHEDESLGLHGTPLDGTTLLHMAIDFDEADVFFWLFENGAEVNAEAGIDADGFGGHTPLFNVVVSQAYQSGRQRNGSMARQLLEAGADCTKRASVRKAIRFIADESEHRYRNVTLEDYGRRFHAREWVNDVALDLIRAAGAE